MTKRKSDEVGKAEWLMWNFPRSSQVSSDIYENNSRSYEQFHHQKAPASSHQDSWSFQPTEQCIG